MSKILARLKKWYVMTFILNSDEAKLYNEVLKNPDEVLELKYVYSNRFKDKAVYFSFRKHRFEISSWGELYVTGLPFEKVTVKAFPLFEKLERIVNEKDYEKAAKDKEKEKESLRVILGSSK